MRELSSLVGLQVVSMEEGTRLGVIADVLIDLGSGRLVAVTLSGTPEFRAILAEDIDVIGRDAIMVSDQSKLRSREDAAEELERGRSVLASPPTIMTSRGTRLGELGTVQIDEGSKQVVRFDVSGGTLKDVTEGVWALPMMEGIVHGADTIIVPHEVVARRLAQTGGLRGALRSLGQRLRAESEELVEHGRELRQQARETAERVAKDAREAAARAREQVAGAEDEAQEDEQAEEEAPTESDAVVDAAVFEATDEDEAAEDSAEPGEEQKPEQQDEEESEGTQ